jgi:hypothetical protein
MIVFIPSRIGCVTLIVIPIFLAIFIFSAGRGSVTIQTDTIGTSTEEPEPTEIFLPTAIVLRTAVPGAPLPHPRATPTEWLVEQNCNTTVTYRAPNGSSNLTVVWPPDKTGGHIVISVLKKGNPVASTYTLFPADLPREFKNSTIATGLWCKK